MNARRIRSVVSLGLFGIVGGVGFVRFPGAVLSNAIDLGGLALAFLLPAQWVNSPVDVWRRWPIVLGSVMVATLAWDAVTAAVVVKRDFLMHWPIVYGSSLVFFVVLLSFHGLLVAVWNGRREARNTS